MKILYLFLTLDASDFNGYGTKRSCLGVNVGKLENWWHEIPVSEVAIKRIANFLNFSSARIVEALLIPQAERETIFEGKSVQKDSLRRHKKKLDNVLSENQIGAELAGYRNTLEAKQPRLGVYSSEEKPNNEIENLYIWAMASRYRISKKPTS